MLERAVRPRKVSSGLGWRRRIGPSTVVAVLLTSSVLLASATGAASDSVQSTTSQSSLSSQLPARAQPAAGATRTTLGQMASQGNPIERLAPSETNCRDDSLTHCASQSIPTVTSSSEGQFGWVQLHPTSSPPDGYSDSGVASYDPADNSVLLFQYDCNPGSTCGQIETWIYSNSRWTQANSTTQPAASGWEVMTYDAADGYVLLYGGDSGIQLNSTWTFQGGNWTNVTRGVSPGPYSNGGMTYDAHDGYVILYSGTNTRSFSNETWAFRSGNWTQLNVTGQAPPPGAWNTNPMVYDPAISSVVFFNGTNSTYLYQGGHWTALYAPLPAGLGNNGGGALLYDPAEQEVLYVGGSMNGVASNTTWAFNGTGWSEIPTSEAPPAVTAPNVVFDDAMHGALFFGEGSYGPAQDNQTWLFGSANLTVYAQPSFGGSIEVGGTDYTNGTTTVVPFGNYSIQLLPNPEYQGTSLSTTSNLSELGDRYYLSGNSSVTGSFDAFPKVTLASQPSKCKVEFDGTSYSNGSEASFSPGTFTLVALACTGVVFDRWVGTNVVAFADPTSNRTSVTLSVSGTITELASATLTFEVTPAFDGLVVFNGSEVSVDTPELWTAGVYPLTGIAAPGWRLAGFSATGGVTVVGGRAIVNGSGTILASFVPFPTLKFGAGLPWCPSVGFNGTEVADGSATSLFEGTYALEAPPCSDALFERWSTTGNATVSSPWNASTTLTVFGNGTVTAVYGPAATVRLEISPTPTAGVLDWNGTTYSANATIVQLLGTYSARENPTAGWTFVGWNILGGGSVSGTDVTVTSNLTLTALFEPTTGHGTNSTPGPPAPSGWIWATVVGGGAAIVGVVLFVRWKRTKTQGSDQVDGQSEESKGGSGK
jgi:hypothetical protein